jgi:seryl-tRNA(Sec) selenium transferase
MNISTRRKLINEIKDYDKHMNGRVANMQKRKILGTTETVEPYTQLNQEELKKMEELTNILKHLLEKKY